MTYFLFNLLVSATQPAGKCSTTQQGPGQSPQQVPSPPSTARVTPPAAGGFVLPLLLSPSPLTAGTACSGAALSPLNEPKRLRNPQPGQGKAQPDPRTPRCCPWAPPAQRLPLHSTHPASGGLRGRCAPVAVTKPIYFVACFFQRCYAVTAAINKAD